MSRFDVRRRGGRGEQEPLMNGDNPSPAPDQTGIITTLSVLFVGFAIGFFVLLGVSLAGKGVFGHDRNVPTYLCGSVQISASDPCYDFIVVGSGSGGSTASKRLSDDFTKSVFVIEAGGDNYVHPIINQTGNYIENAGQYISNPGRFGIFQNGVPEPTLFDRQNPYQGGRGLGGTSGVNGLVAVKGTSAYWDSFDALVGNPGTFTGDAIYANYEEFEWYNTEGKFVASPERGDGSLPDQRYKICIKPKTADPDSAYISTVTRLATGVPDLSTLSYNDKTVVLGAAPYGEFTMDFEVPEYNRWANRRTFYRPEVVDQTTFKGVGGRQLTIGMNLTATSLIWNPLNPTQVVGVNYLDKDGIHHRAYARESVIVAAFWNSAPLLHRSGIGPAQMLAEAQITPRVINENVGANMKQHIFVPVLIFSANLTGTPTDPPLTGSGSGLSGSFMEDLSSVGIPGRRAYQTYSFSFPGIWFNLHIFNFPKSTGYIKTQSSSITQGLEIRSNVLTHPDDLETFREHLRYFYGGLAIADPGAIPLSIDPGTLASDPLLNFWLYQNQMDSPTHLYGSNQMSTSAATGVVDNRFRVFGTTGLRVCDTSVIPEPTDANPSTPMTVLGDICGKMALEDAAGGSSKKNFVIHKAPRSTPVNTQPRGARAKRAERNFNVARTNHENAYNAFMEFMTVTGPQKMDKELLHHVTQAVMNTDQFRQWKETYGP